ncbi:MAG: bifunctional phosphoglucose/phosphomannose isomerase [Ignavibacteriales bacterium]|nr:bifunctional phosphoglucose/phosphomannose isomerase [Ignavibacteriales bacterium]
MNNSIESSIHLYDQANMRKLLIDFPKQVEDAVAESEQYVAPYRVRALNNIILTGLGGSAIGGDLLRSFTADELELPFIVNRHYTLPGYIDQRSFVIVASYSGNTEETIAAHIEATRSKAKVLCISTNGESEQLAKKYGQPYIKIPSGLPPRAALGYSFFPLLMVFKKMKLIDLPNKDIRETIKLLEEKSKLFSSLDKKKNPALRLAYELKDKLPIIYSSTERFDAVNLRWRGQIAENAKQLAFGNVLPEMNHNELVGWNVMKRLMKTMTVVFLRDKDDHARVQLRMKIMKDIVGKYSPNVIEVWSEGSCPLARLFSLVYLGDWVSYYLAILNEVDPTPVKVIDYLKGELAKV